MESFSLSILAYDRALEFTSHEYREHFLLFQVLLSKIDAHLTHAKIMENAELQRMEHEHFASVQRTSSSLRFVVSYAREQNLKQSSTSVHSRTNDNDHVFIDCDCPKANPLRLRNSTNSFCDNKGDCICPRSKMYLTPLGCVPSVLSECFLFYQSYW